MSTHYYISWFNEQLPKKIIDWLNEDIIDRSSLVLISAEPTKPDNLGTTIVLDTWLKNTGIIFDNIHIVDYQTTSIHATQLLAEASVIFLCGGYAKQQHKLITEYKLEKIIKESNAVIIGASAGAINMSSKWLSSKNTTNDDDKSTVFKGLDVDNFFYISKPNISLDDNAMLDELCLFSKEADIYLAMMESVLRIKESHYEIFGDIFIISNEKMTKLNY